jgi:hypothetical protein
MIHSLARVAGRAQQQHKRNEASSRAVLDGAGLNGASLDELNGVDGADRVRIESMAEFFLVKTIGREGGKREMGKREKGRREKGVFIKNAFC